MLAGVAGRGRAVLVHPSRSKGGLLCLNPEPSFAFDIVGGEFEAAKQDGGASADVFKP